ncbi:MAG: hypothetical protein F6K47_07905, partial [Symploca sp. SIO2E6]|nr:hypothetical protein [Symploca sp. SIO2E6]
QMRAAAILRRFGWQKAKRWRSGTWKRGWELPDLSTDPPSDEVALGVGKSHKANEIKVSSYTDPPDPPLDPTFTKNQSLPETPADNTVKNPNENIGESLETSGSVSEVVQEKNVVTAEVVATEQPTPTAPKEVTETTAVVELLNNEEFSALDTEESQQQPPAETEEDARVELTAHEIQRIARRITVCLWHMESNDNKEAARLLSKIKAEVGAKAYQLAVECLEPDDFHQLSLLRAWARG